MTKRKIPNTSQNAVISEAGFGPIAAGVHLSSRGSVSQRPKRSVVQNDKHDCTQGKGRLLHFVRNDRLQLRGFRKNNFDAWIFTCAATLIFCVSSPIHAELVRVEAAPGRTVEAVPNQVLVRYKSGREAAGRSRVMASFGVRARRTIPSVDIEILNVPPGETLQSFLNKLQSDADIEFAEPNGVLRALLDPNDPLFPQQTYPLTTSYINVQGAWDITVGTPSVVIADIDTGVVLTHPDLAANLWVNPDPIGNSGLNGTTIEIDWNGNGDCGDTDPDPELGREQCAGPDPTDDNNPTYHGTRVAGVMAAATNNGTGMAGVCWNCRIMAVKALNNVGAGTFAAIAEAITYAADNGASVINLSLGGTSASDSVLSAVNYAINQKNVVIVAAAGNSGNASPVNFPASISDVIAVGATGSNNVLASFSATGRALDLVAPGVNIMSTVPPATANADINGTSFSAPLVSGVAALIRSLSPSMPVALVTRHLNFNATDSGASGFDSNYGFGRMNATAALQAANEGKTYVSNPADPGETFPYPNPFQPGPSKFVTIALPTELGSSGIEINIMNVAGERIKTLSGTNAWDGKNDDGNYVASGFYFYFAETSRGNIKGKLTVLK